MEITGVEWTALTEDFGYYTVDVDGLPEFEPAPFKNPTLVNPFWAWKVELEQVERFIGDVVEDLMTPAENIGRKCWGNYYNKLRHKTVKFSHLPHMDGPGWVGNLWITDHEPGTRGTKFFSYKDQWKEDKFTFLKDLMKPSCDKKKYLHGLQHDVEYVWENFGNGYIEGWGFEYIGMAPARKNTITVYNSMMPHTAYIEDSVSESYSQLVKVATAPQHKE